MVDYKKLVPTRNYPMRVKTPYGIREVIFDTGACVGFYRYTDCTHPMQNCYCSVNDILEWEYIEQEYMNQGLFIANKHQRQKDADEMLAKINLKITWLDKLNWNLRAWWKFFSKRN